MTPDERYMEAALRLGRRHLGQTGSNPSVATLLVKNGAIIGRGITAKGGWPHAESFAVEEADAEAAGSTAYVTMEPCAHHGKTPPCVDTLIEAKIARVVIPALDPNPLTAGKSIERLKAAGIEVASGVLAQEAARDHAGHTLRILERRPLVQLKMAMTANGVAVRTTTRLMISGKEAQDFTQRLRTQCDAVLVGAGTTLADDPQLSCRLPGLEARSPRRFVFDRGLRLPEKSHLAQTARQIPVVIFTGHDAPEQKITVLENLGVQVRRVEAGRNDFIAAALQMMGEMQVTRLLLEGGPRLAGSFLAQDLVDQALIMQSDAVYDGGDAIAAFAEGADPARSSAFLKTGERRIGQDTLHTYWRARECFLG